MAMEPPSKRVLRPTSSLPTTADTYAARHGIPEDVQRNIEHSGARIRHAVSQGRSWERTQSVPAFNPGTLIDMDIGPDSAAGPSSGFKTMEEIRKQAERLISREALRQRELQPYAAQRPDTDATEQHMTRPEPKLRFDGDGNVMMDGENGSAPPAAGPSVLPEQGVRFAPSQKRRITSNDRAEPGVYDAGSDTDTDIDYDDPASASGPPPDLSNASTSIDEFPPVFTSPQISQPQLFAPPSGLPAPRQIGRKVRGLPGAGRAMLGKTKSAPAGSLFTSGGMDVDGEGGDGFDVSEWAKGEDF